MKKVTHQDPRSWMEFIRAILWHPWNWDCPWCGRRIRTWHRKEALTLADRSGRDTGDLVVFHRKCLAKFKITRTYIVWRGQQWRTK